MRKGPGEGQVIHRLVERGRRVQREDEERRERARTVPGPAAASPRSRAR